jgi:hypothetical protein
MTIQGQVQQVQREGPQGGKLPKAKQQQQQCKQQ